MKSTELRIGNLLATPEGIYSKVDALMIMEIYQCEAAKNTGAFRYSPIPLSPELLSKCGFYKFGYHDNYFYHAALTPHVVKWDNGYTLEAVDDIHIADMFYHLHQLQNIFFWLTDKELEFIKPSALPQIYENLCCDICSRIIKEEAQYCEINDCPHKDDWMPA